MEILEKDFPPVLFLKRITKTSQEWNPDFILFFLIFLSLFPSFWCWNWPYISSVHTYFLYLYIHISYPFIDNHIYNGAA